MVWCGVVWCGAVRCGVVRCGAVRCGVVWCGEGRYGAGRGGVLGCGAGRLVTEAAAVVGACGCRTKECGTVIIARHGRCRQIWRSPLYRRSIPLYIVVRLEMTMLIIVLRSYKYIYSKKFLTSRLLTQCKFRL